MGTLEEGDHVDFVGSLEVGNGVILTKVVLRDMLVLKAPDSGAVESKLGAKPDEGFSAMLQVTDAQAQKLFHVVTHGDWALQLRPVTDSADSRNTVDGSASVMGLARSGRSR